MERERATRRADVDAFLASLGVDPGELAGLELPVTVDVMRERAEFLDSLLGPLGAGSGPRGCSSPRPLLSAPAAPRRGPA